MRMNHCVPEFESEDDYLFPASSNLRRHKKSAMGDEDIMELLWQNDQIVMQNQNQRSLINRKSDEETTPCNLFMQKDEMVSWLHYPNEDNNLDLYLHNNDIFPITTAIGAGDLSTQPPPLSITVPSPRPPIALVKRSENFLHFSRPNNKNLPESAPVNSNMMTQSTGVGSNDRPLQAKMNYYGGAGTLSAGREPETCDISGSSSQGTGGSGASASVEPLSTQKALPVMEDRKRKGRFTDDTECYSEDAEFEYDDGKKQSGGSRSTKRTRAAEVHNLSERRRRDRINEKMKALQELIPRCNKSDKASMLNEAIEYLKSLQMQVQMMSMGYGMIPMMFPGVQRYMPTMAVAAMGLGMGMDQVGMKSPIVPYPTVLPGSAMLNPAAAAPHLAPRFPIPQFQMAQVPLMGPIRGQPPIPSDNPMMNPFSIQNANQPQMVPFADPYQQQYIGLPQTQLPQPQNQAVMPAITSKKGSSKDVRNPEHHPTGKIAPRLDNIHEYNQRLQYGGQPILLPLRADV